jgi:hypothetical protein
MAPGTFSESARYPARGVLPELRLPRTRSPGNETPSSEAANVWENLKIALSSIGQFSLREHRWIIALLLDFLRGSRTADTRARTAKAPIILNPINICFMS